MSINILILILNVRNKYLSEKKRDEFYHLIHYKNRQDRVDLH